MLPQESWICVGNTISTDSTYINFPWQLKHLRYSQLLGGAVWQHNTNDTRWPSGNKFIVHDLPADAKSFLLGAVAVGDHGTGNHLEQVDRVVGAVGALHTVPARLEQLAGTVHDSEKACASNARPHRHPTEKMSRSSVCR